jgi:mannosyl-oligosaccharide glucosidase
MSGNRSKIVAGCVFVAGLLLLLWSWNWSTEKAHGVLTPLHAKPISQLTQFQGKHREQYYWGTYRSTLYLGIRARIPKSILAGFMWLGVKDGQYALRHTCEESDKLSRYAWVCHDGATYGRQEIVDQDLSITTTFLKSWELGSGYGGDWVVRIQAKKQGSSSSSSSSEIQQEKKLVSLFFYVADEGGNSMKISVDSQHTQVATGRSMPPEVGGWELHAKGQVMR